MINECLIDAVLESCESDHTARAYRLAIEELSTWLKDRELSYATLKEYRAFLVRKRNPKSKKMSPQTINIHLGAIRFYVRELVKLERLSIEKAQAICGVENLKVKGRALGEWLTAEQAGAILNAPDVSTRAGLRDRAALALMIGAALRRSEVVGIELRHFEERDGRWIIVGITGKHGRTRNVPIADWVKAIIDAWIERAGITEGPVIRTVNWAENKEWIRDNPMDASSLRYIVQQKYGKGIGRFQLSPHDLRRTSARLAYEGGAAIGQIQLMLGHADQRTTEDYINVRQDLQAAPSDVMNIGVNL
jgi:integrase